MKSMPRTSGLDWLVRSYKILVPPKKHDSDCRMSSRFPWIKSCRRRCTCKGLVGCILVGQVFFLHFWSDSRMLAAQQGYEMSLTDSDSDLPPPDSPSALQALEPQSRVALHAKLYGWTVLHARVVRLLRDSSFLSQEEHEKL